MSTNSMAVGVIFFDWEICVILASRGSGTVTTPTFGSIVQKGYFSAGALWVRVTALKSVDFPTFGSPTIPALNIQSQMNTDLHRFTQMMFHLSQGQSVFHLRMLALESRRTQISTFYVPEFRLKSPTSTSIYGIVERWCVFIPLRIGSQKLLQVGSQK